ncbi:MAG: hypothetical protein LBC86_04480 [Oscillospiraceae bacterium]|jgi:hypothetical protein|nr:hypothetical protein [Oscillospiraceae bacterium]
MLPKVGHGVTLKSGRKTRLRAGLLALKKEKRRAITSRLAKHRKQAETLNVWAVSAADIGF